METWNDVIESEVGKIFYDYYDEGLRVIILRGPASVNAYIGLPLGHPLSGHHYDALPVDCHGGLTFSNQGNGKYLPEGFWWYGWDYGHAGDDFAFSDPRSREIHDQFPIKGDVQWTPDMVKNDAWTAIYEFKKLMRLAESIASQSTPTIQPADAHGVK